MDMVSQPLLSESDSSEEYLINLIPEDDRMDTLITTKRDLESKINLIKNTDDNINNPQLLEYAQSLTNVCSQIDTNSLLNRIHLSPTTLAESKIILTKNAQTLGRLKLANTYLNPIVDQQPEPATDGGDDDPSTSSIMQSSNDEQLIALTDEDENEDENIIPVVLPHKKKEKGTLLQAV